MTKNKTVIDDYTYEMVKEAFNGASSKVEIARRLGWKAGGNTYYRLRILSEKFNLPLPIWVQDKNATKSAVETNRLSDIEWFVEGKLRNGPNSRKRMVAMGIPNNCSNNQCDLKGSTKWCGKEIVFEVDHIDGNRLNNNLNNLRLLCPMCHKQTDTHGGKNVLRSKCLCGRTISGKAPDYCVHSKDGTWTDYKCLDCNKELNYKSKSTRCVACSNKHIASTRNNLRIKRSHQNRPYQITYPPVEEIINKIEDLGYFKYSKEIGISDNGIRKFLKRNNVDPLPKKLNSQERDERGLF